MNIFIATALLLVTASAADDVFSRTRRSLANAQGASMWRTMVRQSDQPDQAAAAAPAAVDEDDISQVVANSRRRICSLEPEMGPCRASLTRWRYNPTTEQCETFIYGGCRGNENNFSSQTRCMRYCTAEPAPPKSNKSRRP